MSKHLSRPAPSKHRSHPPATKRHRSTLRPRYGRIAAFTGALAITGVTLVGGVLVTGLAADPSTESGEAKAVVSLDRAVEQEIRLDDSAPAAVDAVAYAGAATPKPVRKTTQAAPDEAEKKAGTSGDEALPAASGSGRRVVFDQSAQRVWLVDSDNAVERTYPVSGSLTDNLHPGSFAVYSRSRYAVGIDDSGEMQYFVRFTRGENAAIGFHSIPTRNGVPLQTLAQLGTPRSHGCIRQATPDAIALWDFAGIGTPVTVVA